MPDLQRLKEQRRARALAGDARAGSWARGRARSIQREFIRERWTIYACFALAVFVLATGVAITMPSDLLKGMVLGAALVAGPIALWGWTVQVTGTAPVMMGDQAEQWTASELRRLDRRWRLINHVALGLDDIDHVLIGPGGAYAVETKWSASSWHSEYGRDRLRQAVAQAQRNARRLRLWQPLKSRQIPVKPVLVLWSLGTSKWIETERIRVLEGVTVLTGRELKDWIESLDDDALDASQVAQAWSAIDDHIARRDPHDILEHPQPASLSEVAGRAGFAVGSALLAFMVVGQILRWTGSWQLTSAISAAALLPGLALLKVGLARPAAWGWVLGLTIPTLALIAAELISRLA